MAKVSSGILGRLSGKVASVVGGSWKGIAYLREHVTGKDAKTPAQLAIRHALALSNAWARPLLSPFLNQFIDRRTRKMSGINFITKRNFSLFRDIETASDIPSTPNFGDVNLFKFEQRFQLSRGSLPSFFFQRFHFNNNSFDFEVDFKVAPSRLLWTDYCYIIWSDLHGILPTLVQWTRLDGAISSDSNIITIESGSIDRIIVTPTAQVLENLTLTNKMLCSVLTIRFNNPDTRDYPVNISRDSNIIIDGTGIEPPQQTLTEVWADSLTNNWINPILNFIAPNGEGRELLINLNRDYIESLTNFTDIPLSYISNLIMHPDKVILFSDTADSNNLKNQLLLELSGQRGGVLIRIQPNAGQLRAQPRMSIIITDLTNPPTHLKGTIEPTSTPNKTANFMAQYANHVQFLGLASDWWELPELAPFMQAGKKIMISFIVETNKADVTTLTNRAAITIGNFIMQGNLLATTKSKVQTAIENLNTLWIVPYIQPGRGLQTAQQVVRTQIRKLLANLLYSEIIYDMYIDNNYTDLDRRLGIGTADYNIPSNGYTMGALQDRFLECSFDIPINPQINFQSGKAFLVLWTSKPNNPPLVITGDIATSKADKAIFSIDLYQSRIAIDFIVMPEIIKNVMPSMSDDDIVYATLLAAQTDPTSTTNVEVYNFGSVNYTWSYATRQYAPYTFVNALYELYNVFINKYVKNRMTSLDKVTEVWFKNIDDIVQEGDLSNVAVDAINTSPVGNRWNVLMGTREPSTTSEGSFIKNGATQTGANKLRFYLSTNPGSGAIGANPLLIITFKKLAPNGGQLVCVARHNGTMVSNSLIEWNTAATSGSIRTVANWWRSAVITTNFGTTGRLLVTATIVTNSTDIDTPAGNAETIGLGACILDLANLIAQSAS